MRAAPKEVQRERREAASAALGKKAKEREKNAEKSRMKGKNRVSKRYRKKQQNVVDDKKLRANLLKEERTRRAKRAADPGAGDGPEGGAMPGRTAGAASDARRRAGRHVERAQEVLQVSRSRVGILEISKTSTRVISPRSRSKSHAFTPNAFPRVAAAQHDGGAPPRHSLGA